MKSITVGDVIRWTGGQPQAVDLSRPIARLIIDSRQAGPDTLFFALPGTKTDGHQFVEQVWAAGGLAVVRHDWHSADGRSGPAIRVADPLLAMGHMMRQALSEWGVTVVGVTGSVGKTSVKELTRQALSAVYAVDASVGNYNTAIGLPLSFFNGSPGITHFVAEMGMSAPGEIRYLTQIAPPRVAIITSIGPSHLERLGSMEAIQRAKGEILEGVRPDGLAVLNRSNAWVRALGERHRTTPVWWFGTDRDCQAQVLEARVEDQGTWFRIRVDQEQVSLKLPWLGSHHGLNVAASLLTAHFLGVDIQKAAHQLEQIEPTRSRIQMREHQGWTLLEDVYNASPASMRAGLDVLKTRTGRKIAVLGDMLELGTEEAAGHQEVGRYAAEVADWVIGIGPRSQLLVDACLATGHHQCRWFADGESAAAWLVDFLLPGDTVLLKASRGMQFEKLATWLVSGRGAS